MNTKGRPHKTFNLKNIAALTATVFLGTTLLAPWAEANFWEDRQLALRKSQASAENRTVSRSGEKLYAQLPLPAPDQLGHALSSPFEFSSLRGMTNTVTETPAQWPAWLPPVPSVYGDVRSVHILPKSNKPLVVIIQDAHDIYSAQLNVSHMLAHVSNASTKPLLVGVEGSAGAFDFSAFRDDSDPARREAVSNFLLKQGALLGTEHFAILSKNVPLLWGVEEPSLYIRNVQAYRDSLPLKSEFDQLLRSWDESLRPLKDRVFSLKLWALDQHLAAYHKGDEDLLSYIHFLIEADEKASLKNFGEVDKFSRALEMERSLDFARVGQERLAFIQELSRRVSDRQLNGLLRLSLDFRSGQLEYKDYYQSLQRLAENHGLSLNKYSSLVAYIRYGLLAESINRYKLFDQVEALKDSVTDSLASTAEQKELCRMGEDLRLLDRLKDEEFGPAEWMLYARRREEIAALPKKMIELAAKVGVAYRPNERSLSDILSTFETFYKAADERNAVLVENLLNKLDGGARVVAIVAGGFHTESLEKILAAKGLSTITLTPRMENIDAKSGSKYLDAFAMNRTPLEKLLLGEKLDLNTPAATSVALTQPGPYAQFNALHTTTEREWLAANIAWAAAHNDVTGLNQLAQNARAKVSYVRQSGSFIGLKLTFSDGTSIIIGSVLTNDGAKNQSALQSFVRKTFSRTFSTLDIVHEDKLVGGNETVSFVMAASEKYYASFSKTADVVRSLGWTPEILSLALLLIFYFSGMLSPPLAIVLTIFAVLRPSMAFHGLGHALTMARFDKAPFDSSLKHSLGSYISDISRWSFTPSMANTLTDKKAISWTAAMGPMFTLLLVGVGVAAILFGPSSFHLFAMIFAILNGLLLILSGSDWKSVFTGEAFVYNCGNFGILAKRVATDKGLLPGRIRTMWVAMGSQTDVRGQQAGGAAILTKGRKGAVFVGRKIVNRKRDNLTKSLIERFQKDLNGARGVKPFQGFIHLITHYRYGTSSAPAVRETHWHRWSKPRSETVWVLEGGKLVRKTQLIDNLITHNGDFDEFNFPWGKMDNSDPRGRMAHESDDVYRARIKNLMAGPSDYLFLWLNRILGEDNPALGDSPKIAGMMDLLLTQGQWLASLRLAYVMRRASSQDDLPDPKLLRDLAAICENKLKAVAASFTAAPGQSLSEMFAAHPDDVRRLTEDIRAAIVQQTRTWNDAQRLSFAQGAVEYFFRNDLYQASQMFVSRAVGSFGLITTSTLAPGQVVMSSYKQPLSIGLSPEAGLMVYASEPTAIKAAAASLGDISKIPYRYDMRDNEVALLEVGEGDEPNQVTVTNLNTGDLKTYISTEEELDPEERWVDMRHNPYISPFRNTRPKDRVEEEMDDIPRVLEMIKREWETAGSANRQTAEEFARVMRAKAEKYFRERNGEAVDLIILGQENSLFLGEGFASTMAQAFPFMNIKVVDSAAFVADPQSFAIGPDTVVLGVSQSGQTFNTLDSIKFLQELHGLGKCGDVFVLTGELDTLMGLATGQSFRRDAEFNKHILTNLTGWRTAEASTVTSAATFFTLNELFLSTAEALRGVWPGDYPFGMTLSLEDLTKLRIMSHESVARSESIIGRSRGGADIRSKEHAALARQGRHISRFVTEALAASLITIAHLFIVFALHANPVTIIFSFLPALPGLGIVSAALQTIYFMLMPVAFFLIVRKFQHRPILDRLGSRTIVIKDEKTVAQLAEAYLSKLFSLSYGVATFAGIHSADNQTGAALHGFGHRVQRGTLIIHGVPDGRLSTVATAQAGAAMASKQAQGVQNLDTGAHVMAVGANPSVSSKFNSYIPLGHLETQPLPTDPRLGTPNTWSEPLQKLVESRVKAFERLLAFYVIFHATAKSTARFTNIVVLTAYFFGRIFLFFLRIITLGRVNIYIGPWDYSRTQSGTRIATTADPAPAIVLKAADFVSRPLSGAMPTSGATITVLRRPALIATSVDDLIRRALELGAPNEDIMALHQQALETIRTGTSGGAQTDYASLLSRYLTERENLLRRAEALGLVVQENTPLADLGQLVETGERRLGEMIQTAERLNAPASDLDPIRNNEAALRGYIAGRERLFGRINRLNPDIQPDRTHTNDLLTSLLDLIERALALPSSERELAGYRNNERDLDRYVETRTELLRQAAELSIDPAIYIHLTNDELEKLLQAPAWSFPLREFFLSGAISIDVLGHVTADLEQMGRVPLEQLDGYHDVVEPNLQNFLLSRPDIVELILTEFGIDTNAIDENQRLAAIAVFAQALLRRPTVIFPYIRANLPSQPQSITQVDYMAIFVEALLQQDGLREAFMFRWEEFLDLSTKAAILGIMLDAGSASSAIRLRSALEEEWHRRLLNLANALIPAGGLTAETNDRLILRAIEEELKWPGDHIWKLDQEQMETLLRILNDDVILDHKGDRNVTVNEFLRGKGTFRLPMGNGQTAFNLKWNPHAVFTEEGKPALRYQEGTDGIEARVGNRVMVLDPRYTIPGESLLERARTSLSAARNGGQWPFLLPFYHAVAAFNPTLGYVFLPTLVETILPISGLMVLLPHLFSALSTALPIFTIALVALIATYTLIYGFITIWVRLHGANASEIVRIIARRTRINLALTMPFTILLAIINPAIFSILTPIVILIAVTLPHVNVNSATLSEITGADFETALDAELRSPRQVVQRQILKALSGERMGSLLQFRRRYDAFGGNSLRSRMLSGTDSPEALFGERFKTDFALDDGGVQFRSTVAGFILAAFGGMLTRSDTSSINRTEILDTVSALAGLRNPSALAPQRTAGLIHVAEKFHPTDLTVPLNAGTVIVVNLRKPNPAVLKNLSTLLAANGDGLRVILATGGKSISELQSLHPDLDFSRVSDPRVVPVTLESIRLSEILKAADISIDTIQHLHILEAFDAGTIWDTTGLPTTVANAIDVILSIMEGMSLTAPLSDTTNFTEHLRAFVTAA